MGIFRNNQQSSGSDQNTRYLKLVIPILFVLVGLGARFWYLQGIKGEIYYRASSSNIIENVSEDPIRGRIFDRQGRLLAENRPSFNVYATPTLIEESEIPGLTTKLQKYLNLTSRRRRRLEQELSNKSSRLLIARDITRKKVAQIKGHKLALPGISIKVKHRRHYPLNNVGAHAIGFMSQVSPSQYEDLKEVGYEIGDYRGRRGLESAFESLLRGSPGLTRKVVNARGIQQEETKLLIADYQDVSPIPGRDLVTSLDAGLMLTASKQMEDYHSGAVAAIDPDDGSVLALHSKPAFNPNAWSGSLSRIEKDRVTNHPFKPLLNKAISGYFPGSTFKIVGATAALEEGIRSPTDTTWCPGYFRFGGQRFRCWKQVGHGHLNITGAIQQSCDVYFYSVARKLGMDPLAKYAREFGLGSQTGLILDNDSPGRIPDTKWHNRNSKNGYQQGFALNMVLGQGNVLATPLQMALAYGAIGNGGTLYRPKLVDEVRTRTGNLLFELPPDKHRELKISDKTIELLQKGLFKVVNEPGGTAYYRRLDEIEVSGKTGTAQVHKIGRVRIPNKKKSIKLRDHAWFVAYAPSDDPEIAVAVFLEHAGHGGKHAGPVAMAIIQEYLDDTEEKIVDVTLGDFHANQ